MQLLRRGEAEDYGERSLQKAQELAHLLGDIACRKRLLNIAPLS